MHGLNPQLVKKTSLQKKKTHIHFDATNDMDTEEDAHQSIVQQLKKRQNKLLQEEKLEKIVKKSKTNQPFQEKPSCNLYSKHPQKSLDHEHLIKSPQKKNHNKIQSHQKLQSKSVLLLQQLLFHPNRSSQVLINPSLANSWILSQDTPTKIKSFLALYMILHKFQTIEFQFRKTFQSKGEISKTIDIVKAENFIASQQDLKNKKQLYLKFKQAQQKKYLADYLQWLIWMNEANFQTSSGDLEFWAMALNNCEKVATQLIQSQNIRLMQRNMFLSLFLSNAQDLVFRSTVEVPKNERNILYMTRENLEVLPKCHWLLGVNFSLRYFYRKSLAERMQEALNLNNLQNNQVQQFYHQYQLLRNYFGVEGKVQFNCSSLDDSMLEWIAWNSNCRKGQQKSKLLVQQICRRLLKKTIQNPINIEIVQNMILLAVELLQRDNFLQQNDKRTLISTILYQKLNDGESIAFRLGKLFPLAINKLQHNKESTVPKLFQTLTNDYKNFYSHLILSQNSKIRNDLLAQLKHLIKISIEQQNQRTNQRIKLIVTEFNLLTHWNKDVLKTLIFLLDKYIQNLEEFIKKQSNLQNDNKMSLESNEIIIEKAKQKSKNFTETKSQQKDEMQTLCSFIKIHINLEAPNLFNLTKIISLIKKVEKNLSKISFEPRTISYIKKDLLSILFAHNGFNRAVLLEIKKASVIRPQSGQLDQKTKSFEVEKSDLLQELSRISKGMKYFEDQVTILKKEAKFLYI